MDEISRIKDPFYILATASPADDRTRVLKQGETFGVFDRYGDIQPHGLGEEGLYHQGTRFLSRLTLTLTDNRPLLISSFLKEDNALLTVNLTNPDVYVDGTIKVPRGTVHLLRSKFLWEGTCYECLSAWNHGLSPITISLAFRFEADYSDIFEVRGLTRRQRGRQLEARVEDGSVVLAYEGLDGLIRRTRLQCSPEASVCTASELRFQTVIEPQGEALFVLTVGCELGETICHPLPLDEALHQAGNALQVAKSQGCEVYTPNGQFNDWLNRSLADLQMMVTDTPQGPYPYAGVPWFSTAFGRDGIITALETLWINPTIAKGVLSYLAASQATEVVPDRDAEPGKILHETRKGEMAALGEVPFGQYYGSVDATPLFIILAGAYYERTEDIGFIESIWSNIALALEWIDLYGDLDDDGFVEYVRRSPRGLTQQGWKDSNDSVFHENGAIAEGPIALCEVQGYVYAAKLKAAELASLFGKDSKADELARQAEDLRERFERAFWSEELGTYHLALDGAKRPCRVKTSNAGHCLFSGIATPAHARRVMHTLMAGDSFSGWGIRTVAASEVRYNPMSYHNGSVWPHDNALIAQGFARYGFMDAVLRVFAGIFDASIYVDLHRLPELFCGFVRRPGEGPALYPVACAPQSWAAASVFSFLQSCLGLSIKAPERQIHFSRPTLPEFLQEVRIRRLPVGSGSVDLSIQRHEQNVTINILRREGELDLVTIK